MLAVISHADCLKHDAGPGHPECAERLHAINNQLLMSGLDFVVRHYDAPLATKAQLGRVHTWGHIEHIFASAPVEGYARIDDDTFLSPATLDAALRAAGAGVLGVDLVMSGEALHAFCPVRPPGHHAERARAMGFCFFNNIAVAAAHVLEHYGLERIAIADFDAHHGNGTEDIFFNDKRVLFCSTFQHPFYPFSGVEGAAANLVGAPLTHGADSTGFRKAVSDHWLPALEDFRPQFLFISAGFDGHMLDDMAGLRLAEADYAWVTAELAAIAAAHSSRRIVSMLEGGYHLGALARSVAAHVKVLVG